jgi:hypothetical protein
MADVDIECVWMEEEEIHCQEIKSTCSSLETESACGAAGEVDKSGSQLSCVWVMDADGSYSCVKKDNAASCSYYLSLDSCSENLSGSKCVWVESEVEGHRCREKQESCVKITSEATCLCEGAAISGWGTENEKNITCIWVVGNASSSNTPTSTCVSEVCELFLVDMKFKSNSF